MPAPQTVYLADYEAVEFHIKSVALDIKIFADHALVYSVLEFERQVEDDADVVLNGENLQLLDIKINDKALDTDSYELTDTYLTLFSPGENFTLSTCGKIYPFGNTSLEGLYKSGDMICSQCEAEGFRKITWYYDRPDVLSVFTVRLEADKQTFPVLLSNGNPQDSGALDGNRHWAIWHDPYPKPCYLFAAVAGNLQCIEDHYTTGSGRDVLIQFYVEESDLDKCDHAITSLKNAMLWEENVYGLEYDLDIYMVVAVSHFNMGAMENKGLNIFNTSCVLVSAETATDAAFQRVEAVIAHEYFHNWSGNRVTLRDWFQLSLKEGFTVFRDSEFSADMNSRSVKRVEDVNFLRTHQFVEDSGPMAHPVRPESYMEINNFYTVTIYEKGAEVVGMLHTLLGSHQFRQGSDLYFDRFDGQAVTTDDFVAVMEEVSGKNLKQFKNWYSQAGTPVVSVNGEYCEENKEFTLCFRQSCPDTPGQTKKQPFIIPVKLGLLANSGEPFALSCDELVGEDMIVLDKEKQQFTFKDVSDIPVPSLFRGFSAPVNFEYDYNETDLLLMMSADTDSFNRWQAAQTLMTNYVLDAVAGSKQGLSGEYVATFETVLRDDKQDPAIIAKILALPSETALLEKQQQRNVSSTCLIRDEYLAVLAEQLFPVFLARYKSLIVKDSYEPVAGQIAKRSLKNLCLSFLMLNVDNKEEIDELCLHQYRDANNMTDRFAALQCAVHHDRPFAEQLLEEYLHQFRDNALVVDQWFMVQASSPSTDAFANVKSLIEHELFDMSNPNRMRSLVGVFCQSNLRHFHEISGEGYFFLQKNIQALDKINPQIAARMMTPFSIWRSMAEPQQSLISEVLHKIKAIENLSPNVFELVSKYLGNT